MRLMGWKKLRAPIAIVILASTLAGCYTLLKHPTVAEAPEETGYSRCSDCHEFYAYPADYDPWYPPPWWLDPIVITDDAETGLPHRGIMKHEPVKRSIEGGGINITNPGSGGSSGVTPVKREGSEGSSDTGETTVKKKSGDDSQSTTRTINKGDAVKRDSGEKRSDDSKTSDETKDTKEKKKE